MERSAYWAAWKSGYVWARPRCLCLKGGLYRAGARCVQKRLTDLSHTFSCCVELGQTYDSEHLQMQGQSMLSVLQAMSSFKPALMVTLWRRALVQKYK